MGIYDRFFGSQISQPAPPAFLNPVAAPKRIGVFVSYNHKDIKLADALMETLTSLSPDLDVFIDHSGLEGGDDYEAKISDSIRASQWFVMICSGGGKPGKDMSWCFYEAGQFRAKLEAANQVRAIRDRICYLYDGERPSQLLRYQGALVSSTDRNGKPLNSATESDDLGPENTELFGFLELILTKSGSKVLREIDDANVRKLMRNGVRKITSTFEQNWIDIVITEDVFQPRINFHIPPPTGQEIEVLNSDTAIKGEYNALPTIFSIAGAETTWADIRAKSAKHMGNGMMPLWINDLEAAVKEMAQGGMPRQTDFLCFGTDEKYYRPIVARNENFRSKAKKCYVAFVPSRDRRFNLTYKTSLLLSALILSVRFRQRVLPLVDDLKKIERAPASKKSELLQKIQNEIVMVEAEAMEFGLTPPKDEHDEPPLLGSFRDGPDKDFLRAQIIKWSATRTTIFDQICEARDPAKATSWSDAATLVIAGFDNLGSINGIFIDSLCNELLYAEKVDNFGPGNFGPAAISLPSLPDETNDAA
jgi:TIR domain